MPAEEAASHLQRQPAPSHNKPRAAAGKPISAALKQQRSISYSSARLPISMEGWTDSQGCSAARPLGDLDEPECDLKAVPQGVPQVQLLLYELEVAHAHAAHALVERCQPLGRYLAHTSAYRGLCISACSLAGALQHAAHSRRAGGLKSVTHASSPDEASMRLRTGIAVCRAYGMAP